MGWLSKVGEAAVRLVDDVAPGLTKCFSNSFRMGAKNRTLSSTGGWLRIIEQEVQHENANHMVAEREIKECTLPSYKKIK